MHSKILSSIHEKFVYNYYFSLSDVMLNISFMSVASEKKNVFHIRLKVRLGITLKLHNFLGVRPPVDYFCKWYKIPENCIQKHDDYACFIIHNRIPLYTYN